MSKFKAKRGKSIAEMSDIRSKEEKERESLKKDAIRFMEEIRILWREKSDSLINFFLHIKSLNDHDMFTRMRSSIEDLQKEAEGLQTIITLTSFHILNWNSEVEVAEMKSYFLKLIANASVNEYDNIALVEEDENDEREEKQEAADTALFEGLYHFLVVNQREEASLGFAQNFIIELWSTLPAGNMYNADALLEAIIGLPDEFLGEWVDPVIVGVYQGNDRDLQEAALEFFLNNPMLWARHIPLLENFLQVLEEEDFLGNGITEENSETKESEEEEAERNPLLAEVRILVSLLKGIENQENEDSDPENLSMTAIN